MNCPGGMLVYTSQPHSYRELPLRVGEIGLVHRHELSGALHGLFRVRCFNQDDAHVFMTREQMKDVIQETVRLFDEVYSTFGLSYTIELSTMPEDHIGTVEEWERNQDILKNAITDMGKDFRHQRGRRRVLRPQAGSFRNTKPPKRESPKMTAIQMAHRNQPPFSSKSAGSRLR